MINYLQYLVNRFGILGIFLILFIEGLGTPFPTQIAYLGAVALINNKKFSAFVLIMVISIGNLTGNILINLLLRSGRKSIISFFERFLKIKRESIEQVSNFFKKYGIFAIPIARIIGVPRTPVIFLAGISKMNFYEYTISSFIGNTIWATFYVYFYWYGFSLFKFLYTKNISLFWAAIGIVVAVIVIVWVVVLKVLAKKRRV